MAGGLEPQLARGGAIEQPGFEHAVSDDHGRRDGQSLPIIGTRAQAAGAVRIVGDVDAAREHPAAEAIEQEARLAGDRTARNRAEQMTEQAAADPRIEHHGHRAALDAARIEGGPQEQRNTSELPSLMRISYAVFCLKKKTQT